MNQEEEGGGVSFLVPGLLSLAQTILSISGVVALIATAYLVFGIFSGQLAGYDALSHADRLRVQGNISLAGNALLGSLIAAALCAAVCFFEAESTGWVLLGAAALLGFGVPFGFSNFGGGTMTNGIKLALSAFPPAAIAPAAIGAFLVIKDLYLKTVSAVRDKVFDSQDMTYGTGAVKENKPVRTSILAKCWEGPYCREFIRNHCPIFQQRKACWKERRGCYCDEDIVSNAATKVKGVMLEMAPASESNFAGPTGTQPVRKASLTDWQKAERCRNCIIYNEHQREKYKIFMPLTILGTIAGAFVFSQPAFAIVKKMIGNIDGLVQRISFTPGGGPPKTYVELADWAVWAIVFSLAVMLISKALQTLEWLVFVKKV
ncbi:MAG: hypothetical protein QM758_07565 [Armatimonas sp.]